MADKKVVRRTLRRIRKSNSTGTIRVASVRPMPLKVLKAPLNVTTINVDKYKLDSTSTDAECEKFRNRTPHSLRLKIKSFKRTKSRTKSLNEGEVCNVIVKKDTARFNDRFNMDNGMECSPGGIPSWPVATSTPKRIVDPLAKADKRPLQFAQDSINSTPTKNQDSEEVSNLDAGHTPPIPNKWQVRKQANLEKAERLAALNKSFEHKRIGSGIKHMRNIGKHLTGKRKTVSHVSGDSVVFSATSENHRKSRLSVNKSPTKGRLNTKNAGCTPPKLNRKDKKTVSMSGTVA